MVNFQPSVSETIAGWSKITGVFLIFFMAVSLFAAGQDGKAEELSRKERHKFNEVFFEAEKEKTLGNLKDALELYEKLYKMSPDNATVAYEMARILATEGEQDEAITYAEKAVELEPENKWFLLMLGSIYRNFQYNEKEIEVFENLVQLDSTNPDYRYELAMAYYGNGKMDEAIGELNSLENLVGINQEISNQKKEIYLQQEDLDGAVNEIKSLIKAYPRNVEYRGTLAQLYLVNGFEEKALQVYEELMAVAPEDPRPHLDLAKLYRTQGNFEKSLFHLEKAMKSPNLDIDEKVPVLLSLFEASFVDSALQRSAYMMLDSIMKQNPTNPKAFAIYGDFLSRDGRNEEALQAYLKATELEGGNRFQIWEQILLIEIQGQMYDSLIEHGPRALEMFPNQPLPYFFTGVALSMKGKYNEAIGYLEDGLIYVLGNPRLKEQFYSQLAEAYHRLGEGESSNEYFDKALALNSQNPTTLNNYAYYLSESGENLDKALELTEKSNNLSPGNPTFLDTWAWVLYQRGDYEKALDKMEKVLELGGGESGEVLEHYGDILFKNGRTDEAVAQWRLAKTLGGTSENIDEKINSRRLVN